MSHVACGHACVVGCGLAHGHLARAWALAEVSRGSVEDCGPVLPGHLRSIEIRTPVTLCDRDSGEWSLVSDCSLHSLTPADKTKFKFRFPAEPASEPRATRTVARSSSSERAAWPMRAAAGRFPLSRRASSAQSRVSALIAGGGLRTPATPPNAIHHSYGNCEFVRGPRASKDRVHLRCLCVTGINSQTHSRGTRRPSCELRGSIHRVGPGFRAHHRTSRGTAQLTRLRGHQPTHPHRHRASAGLAIRSHVCHVHAGDCRTVARSTNRAASGFCWVSRRAQQWAEERRHPRNRPYLGWRRIMRVLSRTTSAALQPQPTCS